MGMMTRRGFTQAFPSAAVLAVATPVFAQPHQAWSSKLDAAFRQIERDSGGRLGVFVLDTQSGLHAGCRQNERFPMCSTFKLVLAAAVLKRVDQGKETLDRRIHIAATDIISNSPATEKHVGDTGMTLAELCEATTTLSDNAAANLILATLGGPQGMTAFARSIGDKVLRLDRFETAMSDARPGDKRDTTSPQVMTETIQKLVLGDVLSEASKTQLIAWLVGNKTGDTRLRAGVPKDWRVGDKTGTGGYGTTNDIGLFWPPHRKPIIVSAYLTGSKATSDERNATMAAVARAIATA
nr:MULTISPECIES: class A beta-lactamase [unclassified Beijerinckia]